MFDDKRLSFSCNPAAWLHPDWESRLPHWGMPDRLAHILWESRRETGELSRFLAERFALHPIPISDLEDSLQKLLLMEYEPFEKCLTRLGMIFLAPKALNILDGAQLRRLKKELGDESFDFMRSQAQNRAELKVDISFSVSKRSALLLGLAAFLKRFPARSDVLTRLWLKLPPFADEPVAPEGFGQVCLQLDQMDDLSTGAMDEIFAWDAA